MIKIIFLVLFFNSILCFCQQKDMFLVARSGSVLEMESILKENPDAINSKNTYGFSPLILACYNSNNEVASYLIDKNADVNYISQEGTALMAATVKGNIKLVELLLLNGANPNLTDENGTTALMYAVQFKNETIIKLLLANKADASLLNQEGKTAFEYAVFSKNDNIINLLK